MSFWNIFKNLNYKLVGNLFVWFLKHPLFMFATVKATYYTLNILQKEFPNIHDKNNQANAFRHSLWNVLIAKECNKFSKDTKKVLNWTKKITDWHEEFSVNQEMARLMDLHNNHFGRTKYVECQKLTTNLIVNLLKGYLNEAVLVHSIKDFERNKNRLTYLEV